MITKKEDLYFTHVKNEPELRDAFIAKCKEFGIGVLCFDNHESYLEVYSNGYGEFEICGTDDLEPQSKELTLSDLKPRTKTEFVKCEYNHAWEAVKAFEEGEKFYTKRSHKDFVLIEDLIRLFDGLHRKVETEIDERQEFIDAVIGGKGSDGYWFNGVFVSSDVVGVIYDSGKFKLVEK